MKRLSPALAAYAAAALLFSQNTLAQDVASQPDGSNLMRIDATQPAPAPEPVAATLGTARNPNGEVLGVNSQYLTLNGKPWIPVMGEFHFSRYPETEWEQEILKMKAAGVEIISTYIIWIHHEETEGTFDWSGQRDLRRFVELCGRHGMYVYPRIGPWAHAEVRNGGFPDWVVKAGGLRQNDPTYLSEVQTFYAQIAKQLNGELWKDGGPVIGIQLENEYRETGPGKGDEHIRTLKKMAVADGLDVPLYTVTGWDGAAIPLDSVLPVFGGYPDAPWDGTSGPLPPVELYAYRFNNRSAGNMGAIGGHGQSASSTYRGTPFLTAEVGDGIEDTYFRRPVVSADDIAAILPVMLGSGANLLGYYMFHGGRNPDGGAITLQESQRTGYPTDVPEKSYDFQAPLGEYGQEEASLRKLKLVHYFLEDFGAALAPMTPRRPDRLPASPSDASLVRVSARVDGKSGFVFVSNYVRQLDMPARPGFQVALALPSGTVRIPETPIDLPAGSFGIWPVNLPLGSATLRYSTAQVFKRVQANGKTSLFFFALPGIVPEFALEGKPRVHTLSGDVSQSQGDGGTRLRVTSPTAEIDLGDVHLILLPETAAENVWQVDDPAVLLETAAYAYSDGLTWTLQSTGNPTFDLGVFGAKGTPHAENAALHPAGGNTVFRIWTTSLPPVTLTPGVKQVSAAQPRAPWTMGPPVSWRKNPIPLAPDDSDFAKAAEWTISVPPLPATLSDAFLTIRYQGDAARLYTSQHLLDDNFWNGVPWTLGLRELGERDGGSFALRVLPLPERYPMFLQEAQKLRFQDGVADQLEGIEIVPQYRLVLHQAKP